MIVRGTERFDCKKILAKNGVHLMSSHLPELASLVRACMLRRGSFLEIGGGFYSTSLLAGLMPDRSRTCEAPGPWLDTLREWFPGGPDGDRFITNLYESVQWFARAPYPRYALIDSEPREDRRTVFESIAEIAQVVLVHDWESVAWKCSDPWRVAYVNKILPRETAVLIHTGELLS